MEIYIFIALIFMVVFFLTLTNELREGPFLQALVTSVVLGIIWPAVVGLFLYVYITDKG